ncbi:voltage-gated purine nucleotide uniporter SLC17A9-like [Diadema antillarum]|uniref:voltage-gated purine nucleotide uniporter SLC17A9-like n=1 Tax=Diadema antillarum TaxID=105358 RepID=UPI003A849DA3
MTKKSGSGSASSSPRPGARSPNHSSQWSERERKQWTLVLFVGTTLAYSCRTAMSIVAVSLADEFNWDKAQLGLVLGSFFWGYPILQIPGGGLSDRVGGDLVITVCALFWAVLTVITPIVPYLVESKEGALALMIIVRLLQGLAQSPHYPSMSSLVGEKVSAARKGNAIATLFAATGFGTLVNGFVGSILLEQYGWHSVFYLFGSLSILWTVAMRLFSKHSRQREAAAKRMEHQRDDLEPLVSNGNGSVSEEKSSSGKQVKPFSCLTLMSKVPFWGMLLSHQCIDFVFFTALSWLPTYFTESFPEGKGWVFNVLPWVLAFIASVGSGWLGDWLIEKGFRVGVARKVVVTIAYVGIAIPSFLVTKTHSYHLALACMVVIVGSQAMCNGSISVNPQDITPDHAGLVFGITNGLAGLQGFLASYIVGVILHKTGQWSIVFQMAGGMSIVGWFIFVFFAAGYPVM